MFELVFTKNAQEDLGQLERSPRDAGLVKQIKKTLGFLQTNPRHPSLQTHIFHSMEHPYHPRKTCSRPTSSNTPRLPTDSFGVMARSGAGSLSSPSHRIRDGCPLSNVANIKGTVLLSPPAMVEFMHDQTASLSAEREERLLSHRYVFA